MTQPALTASLLRDRCPVHPVAVRLPLETIAELDERARAGNLTRGQLLYQLIDAALHEDPPYLSARSDIARRPEVLTEPADRPREPQAARR